MSSVFRLLTSALCVLLLGDAVPAAAQEKKEPPPVVLMASPLGVPVGSTTKVTLRGLRLDGATEVKGLPAGIGVKIVGQGNAAFPNTLKAEKVGDRQVEIEVMVPADAASGEVALTVVTPKGETAPYKLWIGGEFPVIDEKEPNDGFAQAQPIAVPQIVNGSIHGDRNVEVFAVEGQGGQKLVAEVFAARRGSALDPLLSLYNARGNVIATHDDLSDSPDARLEVTLPATGRYFLVLQDANDLGGAMCPYRLVVRSEEK